MKTLVVRGPHKAQQGNQHHHRAATTRQRTTTYPQSRGSGELVSLANPITSYSVTASSFKTPSSTVAAPCTAVLSLHAVAGTHLVRIILRDMAHFGVDASWIIAHARGEHNAYIVLRTYQNHGVWLLEEESACIRPLAVRLFGNSEWR